MKEGVAARKRAHTGDDAVLVEAEPAEAVHYDVHVRSSPAPLSDVANGVAWGGPQAPAPHPARAASPAYEAERNSTIERGPTATLPSAPGGEVVGVVAGS